MHQRAVHVQLASSLDVCSVCYLSLCNLVHQNKVTVCVTGIYSVHVSSALFALSHLPSEATGPSETDELSIEVIDGFI